jgi:glycosyltransferase involved in cell wall biosynthesis
MPEPRRGCSPRPTSSSSSPTSCRRGPRRATRCAGRRRPERVRADLVPRGRVAGRSDTLVFLGHPKPWHGADRLVGLLDGLADRGHSNLTCSSSVTAREPTRSGCAAERLGFGGQVEVTGALPPAEASARLRDAAIGLAPYPPQGDFYFSPLKIVDYLAAGLPIVATRQGAVTSLVGDAGIVVPADDEDAFVAAVAELLLDPARAHGSAPPDATGPTRR